MDSSLTLMHNLVCDFCSSDQRFARGLVCSPHPASFRFHLTMDTLAFDYILPTTGRIQDLHLLETCAARRTTQKAFASNTSRKGFPLLLKILPILHTHIHPITDDSAQYIMKGIVKQLKQSFAENQL